MPSIAVVATWVLIALWMVALGSVVWPISARRLGRVGALRVSLWFGVGVAFLLLLSINLVIPLASAAAVLVVALVTVLFVLVTGFQWVRGRRNHNSERNSDRLGIPLWSLPLLAGLGIGLFAFAHATFGPVNQWDAGLYHLNAIQFASEYRVIPGLANLHDRLGVTNGHHLLTAFLSNTGWGVNAFRFQVGFFAFLAAIELALRFIQERHRRAQGIRIGTILLSLGLIGIWPFLLGNPDELVTSPSPDSVALLLTIVGAAFLADAFAARSWDWATAGVVTLAVAASVRAQLWVFVALTIAVWVVFVARTRTAQSAAPSGLLIGAGGVLAAGLAVTTQIRDAIQTGWLLFPLDLLPLPVDWKAFDPAASRAWIVSWARLPGASPDQVNDNWSWVGDWTTRTMSDWAVQLTLGLLMLALTLWLVRARFSAATSSDIRPARALLILIPTTIGIVLWFISAPDPRFAWGLIVLTGAVPCAVALSWTFASKRMASVLTAGIAALFIVPASVVALTEFNAWQDQPTQILTFDGVPWTISAAVVPVPEPELTIYTLPSGQELITPVTDDRCWLAFPLCRPYPNDTLIFRGGSVQDGFASRQWTDVTPAVAPTE